MSAQSEKQRDRADGEEGALEEAGRQVSDGDRGAGVRRIGNMSAPIAMTATVLSSIIAIPVHGELRRAAAMRDRGADAVEEEGGEHEYSDERVRRCVVLFMVISSLERS